MDGLTPRLEALVAELGKLPGIGRKTALRLGLHLLLKDNRALDLAGALLAAAEGCRFCAVCGNLSEEERCPVCANPARDAGLLCVVEQVPDLLAIERLGGFRGVYHVLGGLLSPLDGVGPEQLRLVELERRVAEGGVREVVLALAATVEGDATALYLQRHLQGRTRLSRLARGLPSGGSLETADALTLSRALDGRETLG